MTDTHSFAKISEHPGEQLWNVTLLPLSPRRQREQDAELLENLDEVRTRVAAEAISPSFESQRKAVGW